MTRKLNWGLIGGGEGSQIGPAHRLSAAVDGQFAFVAGALDHRPEEGRAFGQRLGLAPDRSYGNWREMLEGEKGRPDRVDLSSPYIARDDSKCILCGKCVRVCYQVEEERQVLAFGGRGYETRIVADDDLNDARGVPQIYEGDTAMVSATGHPAGEGDVGSDVGGTQGSCFVGAQHGDVPFSVPA